MRHEQKRDADGNLNEKDPPMAHLKKDIDECANQDEARDEQDLPGKRDRKSKGANVEIESGVRIVGE